MKTAIRTTLGSTLLVLLGASLQAQSPAPAAAPDTPAPATAPAPASAVAAAAAAATPEAAAPAPKIVAVEAIKDVGKVAKSDKVKIDFEIRNSGAAELIIQDVRPTCGCTVASFDAKIAPGASGKIHAEVDTIDFAGPIAKTITVLSNDPTTPRLTLTIKATVLPQVEVHPGFARYIYVQSHDPGLLKQWLWTDNFADFKVTGIVSPYKFLTASFHQATPDELRPEVAGNTNQWIVETTIQPDAEVGALREFLIVKTNHPKQKEMRIPITGFVRPVMSVTPYIADFGAIDVAESAKDMSLILVNFGEEAIEIKKVTTTTPGVEATVRAIEAGRRYEIKLALTSKMPKGAVNSMLKIETTSVRKPTIDVPLKGTVS